MDDVSSGILVLRQGSMMGVPVNVCVRESAFLLSKPWAKGSFLNNCTLSLSNIWLLDIGWKALVFQCSHFFSSTDGICALSSSLQLFFVLRAVLGSRWEEMLYELLPFQNEN